MAAPSQDHTDGHELPARNRRLAQLAPWLYLGVLSGSGWLLFLQPQTRVLQPGQAATSWLLAWIFGGIVIASVLWSLKLARHGLGASAASYPLSARLPDSWADAYAALLRPAPAAPLSASRPDPAGTQRGAAWHRFGGGMLSVENFDPNDATRAPWDTLDAQACISRLDDLRPAWQNATANRALQQERRYWLDVVLSLLDHGVMRPLQDGYLPDTATLRTERFLLGADAGPIVLAEVPALFARRLALAIETMPAPQREAAGVQWLLLQQLHGLVAESRMLDERSQVIQVLAWNPDVDLDQVEVAYILAAEYRQGMRDWLRRAALVRLPDSALRLDEVLLSSCSPLGAQADDVDYIEAMRPLHRGFMQLFSQRLSQLVLQAEQAERQAGLYPLPRATAASDEISQDWPA
ncbi:hypothetical protein QSH39_001705 [Xanthomonas arboricola pv. corylina]|uniref:Uncharacterized protein n=1 Tax=Xanthomonas arboricola pv. corylina TaxID=487821 RepID=A0A2S7CMB2_9XANT|nr:hypothetical protein [Xanthomonas arboricola]MDN0201419.1 hypothetical protein [Xanthomonas arboricola pv. corylina]MDN0205843.1 hypothetical protein [Xanthomonas arboricola pv. corylina]MDN0210623.1 hypothetical protein [Xanthomonas arboricola pv. corylina]MDN0214751.1 hypothetical protein [Xanthomonas arboricola pv. corylina]PPU17125.1 hypothetical protein XacyCFBP2565_00965 [Xanthomonas arboricola pv. corylina]